MALLRKVLAADEDLQQAATDPEFPADGFKEGGADREPAGKDGATSLEEVPLGHPAVPSRPGKETAAEIERGWDNRSHSNEAPETSSRGSSEAGSSCKGSSHSGETLGEQEADNDMLASLLSMQKERRQQAVHPGEEAESSGRESADAGVDAQDDSSSEREARDSVAKSLEDTTLEDSDKGGS